MNSVDDAGARTTFGARDAEMTRKWQNSIQRILNQLVAGEIADG